MQLSVYLPRIKEIAEGSGSEAKLEGDFNQLLKEIFSKFGIEYNPRVNETLKALGLSSHSEMETNRPDSVFGHVILDYKEPGKLAKPSEFARAKSQMNGYLSEAIMSERLPGLETWAGILFDGYSIAFSHYTGSEWHWTPAYPVSEASLLTLVQIYRSLNREPLNSRTLNRYFGRRSAIAGRAIATLTKLLLHPQHRTNLLYREWRRLFEQAATYDFSQLPQLKEWIESYGIRCDDASIVIFAFHTYYSIIVKLLTADLLASTRDITGSLVEQIANIPNTPSLFKAYKKLEDGSFYKNYRISNFLEGDFFSWYASEEAEELSEVLIDIAQIFQKFEPATAKLKPESIKDLLKEFYSGILDDQLRHDLGEFYTADWLAQYLLNQAGYEGDPGKVLIDPACGSGTFLVESISRLRRKCESLGYSEEDTLNTVIRCIKGLDLNPLAVISARANYILSVADLVFELGSDIEIPVYLADAINVPEEKHDGTFEYLLDTEVKEIRLKIPSILVKNQVLGKILLKCEEDIFLNHPVTRFINDLHHMEEIKPFMDEDVEMYLTNFYEEILALNTRTPPWDGIWCRIVKNNFSPSGFGKADYIVGNPPWVRWSRLPLLYRRRVKRFCDYYGLVSGRGYSGGIESDISTVLVFSAVDNWLKTGGKVAVLITWTVFKAASARGFRKGFLPNLSGIKIDQIEDLSRIQPFSDASTTTGIYIGTKKESYSDAVFEQIPCCTWFPRRRAKIDPSLALENISRFVNIVEGIARPITDFGSPLYTGRASDYQEGVTLRGSSPYLNRARRGTVNDLARVYWVKVTKYSPSNNRAFIETLSEEEFTKARSVEKTEGTWIEADLLYPLVRGREAGRFSYSWSGWYQIIPNQHYSHVDEDESFAHTYPLAYGYLMKHSSLLENRSTYKRYLREQPIYSIYCIGDYSFHRSKWSGLNSKTLQISGRLWCPVLVRMHCFLIAHLFQITSFTLFQLIQKKRHITSAPYLIPYPLGNGLVASCLANRSAHPSLSS